MAQKQYSQEFKEQVIKNAMMLEMYPWWPAGTTYPQIQFMAG